MEWRGSISTMPWCLSHAKKRPKKVPPPLHITCMVWATFSWRPASDMMTLKVDPVQLGLDGLIHQRVVRVVDDLGPVGFGEAHGELVGIERGARDHGEDLAGCADPSNHQLRSALPLHWFTMSVPCRSRRADPRMALRRMVSERGCVYWIPNCRIRPELLVRAWSMPLAWPVSL